MVLTSSRQHYVSRHGIHAVTGETIFFFPHVLETFGIFGMFNWNHLLARICGWVICEPLLGRAMNNSVFRDPCMVSDKQINTEYC